jgi:hypothetical protein
VQLIVTIDTEEDTWGVFTPGGHTLKNIERIPDLQELFDSFQVKPTYLVTYPVATDEKSAALFREIEKRGRCEIGMHCHPWNTPPFEEELNERNSMLCNLPPDLQLKKMSALHGAITENIGVRPLSFRSGRWGYSRTVAENLLKLDYKVDTSVTSYTDWRHFHGPDFSDIAPRPFRFSPGDAFREDPGGPLLEIPATIGYLQHFAWSSSLSKALTSKPLRRLRLLGILDRMRLLNKVWLCPELYDGKQMIRLAKSLMKKKYSMINMFFHSTTLMPGLNDFVKTSGDEKIFLRRIKEFLAFTADNGIGSIRLSEASKSIKPCPLPEGIYRRGSLPSSYL